MNPRPSPPSNKANEEILVLIATLHEAGLRLEALTSGEVDTVAGLDGRPLLLPGSQEHFHQNRAARKAAILNALPAHIALLDTQGTIQTVNEGWSRFALANGLQGPLDGVGLNYLATCDHAKGPDASEAGHTAAGIRSVMTGEAKTFSLEYPCHSPTEQRWFLLTVTPLHGNPPNGVVVMHLNITGQKQARQDLLDSESRFHQMAEASDEVFFLQDIDTSKIYYVSPAFERIWGRTCESLYVDPMTWSYSIHPDDREYAHRRFDEGRGTGFDYEFRIVTSDGDVRWIHTRAVPILDSSGSPYRIAGIASDITKRRKADDALRESERRFSDMLGNVELISVMLDREARVTYCNDYLLRLTGQGREEVIGERWVDLFAPPGLINTLGSLFSSLLADDPATRHHENELRTRSGECRLIRWSNSVLRSDQGEVVGTASIGEDITERRQAQVKIAFLNRVYAVLSGINTLIVRVNDRDELFKEACRIAVEDGGFRMALIAMLDQATMMVVPVASAGKDEGLMTAIKGLLSSSESAPKSMTARAMKGKTVLVSNDSQNDPQVLVRDKYAEAGVCSMAVFPLIVSDEAVGVLALYAKETGFFREEELKLLTELTSDIAFAIDHIDKQARLNYLAYYDVLTGLANRSLFLERVAQYGRSAVAGGHKLALFLTDLERFKNINDSLGRPAGDELLRQVAAWLTRIAGDANLVARVGADQFAVVLPEVRQGGDLARMLEKLIATFLEHPFHLNDAVFRVAARGGVSLFPDDGTDADTLFNNAEAALKRAKARGERYLFYSAGMNAGVASRLTLENQLRQALNNGEFVLYYQPKVNLASGKLTSAEALIRWNDPRTGLVPPGKFIPVLEDTGMIYDVGRWAMRQAIEDYLRWRNAGLPAVRLAVNVSPLQLRNRGFIAEVREAIEVDPQAAEGLELEITESLIMEDIKQTLASLMAIRGLGVSVAIDDFGTGFSSLSYLSRLPVDTLKIDRSFIIDMTEGPDGLSLVSTIINLAHSLKLKVVAEGVETEEQSRLLRLLGCDEMQGFLFSRPVPREIFESLFLAPPPTQ